MHQLTITSIGTEVVDVKCGWVITALSRCCRAKVRYCTVISQRKYKNGRLSTRRHQQLTILAFYEWSKHWEILESSFNKDSIYALNKEVNTSMIKQIQAKSKRIQETQLSKPMQKYPLLRTPYSVICLRAHPPWWPHNPHQLSLKLNYQYHQYRVRKFRRLSVLPLSDPVVHGHHRSSRNNQVPDLCIESFWKVTLGRVASYTVYLRDGHLPNCPRITPYSAPVGLLARLSVWSS